MAALAAVHEQQRLAKLRKLPPPPSELARRADAAARRRMAEEKQALALHRAELEAQAAAWEKAMRPPLRRQPARPFPGAA